MPQEFFFENGRSRMSTDKYKRKTSVIYPLAFNHLALMDYHPDRSIEEIIVFEKLVVFYRSGKLKPFYYQRVRLIKELKIKRDRLEKALDKLEEVGILKVENPGNGKKTKYSIELKMIIQALPYIYKMPDNKHAEKSLLVELEDFFTYYLTTRYLTPSHKLTIPDHVYEGKVSLLSPDKRSAKSSDINTDSSNDDKQ